MKNKVIHNRTEMEAIIRKCQVCYISMMDQDGWPYVLPMNFGYLDDIIYFHGAQEGKKTIALSSRPEVCIAFSADHQLRYVNEEVACSWSMRYRSVLAYGRAEFVIDPDEKVNCLNIIMSNYSNRKFSYNAPAIREVMVFKVKVEKMEGRTYGY